MSLQSFLKFSAVFLDSSDSGNSAIDNYDKEESQDDYRD